MYLFHPNPAGATVFTNPYQEMEDAEKAEAEAARKREEAEAGLLAGKPEYQVIGAATGSVVNVA
jgi:hypothetical protein